jgi:hypothetical protein
VQASDDEDDEDDEDEEDEDDEDEDGDIEMDDEPKKQLFTPSKRKKKQDEEESVADSESLAPSTEGSEEDETETIATSVDDGLPHPRVSTNSAFAQGIRNLGWDHLLTIDQPFESRRDFFQRTSAEWQEVLMTSLRWKGIQPETLTVKEIKAKAFELSEEKWWDCREEITALEDEQEAAGIGEVVSLADKAAASGGAGRRR